MLDDEERGRLVRSVLEGLGRGFSVCLVVMAAIDLIAFSDAAGLMRSRLHHPSIVMCLVLTLLPLAAWLEVEHAQYRQRMAA